MRWIRHSSPMKLQLRVELFFNRHPPHVHVLHDRAQGTLATQRRCDGSTDVGEAEP